MSNNITREDTFAREQQLKKSTSLGDREAEVTALKERGLTHAEIADELGIEKGTVDSHANRARIKYSQAYHTVRELEPTYDGKAPDPNNYTGVIFYYDPDDDFSRDVLLPAARGSNEHNQFTALRVTESRMIGGLLEHEQISHTPALLYCEGEPLELWEGVDDLLEYVNKHASEIGKSIGFELGYYDADDGWTV